jgi:hypothetical protein
MKKMQFLILFLIITGATFAQTKGVVTVVKDPLIDSLIAKRVALNKIKPITTNLASNAIVSQMGYRVQVFYGSDRRLTFSEQARFKTAYPKFGTYIIYKEPNYYLRVGDFRTRMEAQKLLNELKTSFPTLFIFKEKINAPDLEKINN